MVFNEFNFFSLVSDNNKIKYGDVYLNQFLVLIVVMLSDDDMQLVIFISMNILSL